MKNGETYLENIKGSTELDTDTILMQPRARAARLIIRLRCLLLDDARQSGDVVFHERRETGTQHGGFG